MKNRKLVSASEKSMLPNAKVVGRLDPHTQIEITVLVRRRNSAAGQSAQRRDVMALGTRLPEERRYPSRGEFAATRGADPADMAKVDAFAQENNLTVVQTSIPK